MAIKTDELQQAAALKDADTLLLASSASGTSQLPLAQAVAWFGAKLVREDNPVGTALSSKAALSVQETVEAKTASSRAVEVEAANLPAYIAGLPRLLTENLTITVPGGTQPGSVVINGFYGPGSLAVQAKERAAAVAANISVKNCSVPVSLKGLTLNMETTAGALLRLDSSAFVIASNMVFDRQAGGGDYGVCVYSGSTLVMDSCTVSNAIQAVVSISGSVIVLKDCTASGNTYGIAVSDGGSIFLSGTTPELMGGNTALRQGGAIFNKDGALIAKSNGTTLP